MRSSAAKAAERQSQVRARQPAIAAVVVVGVALVARAPPFAVCVGVVVVVGVDVDVVVARRGRDDCPIGPITRSPPNHYALAAHAPWQKGRIRLSEVLAELLLAELVRKA